MEPKLSTEFTAHGDVVYFRKSLIEGETDEEKLETVRIENFKNGIFQMNVESADNETSDVQLLAEALSAWRGEYQKRIVSIAFIPSDAEHDDTLIVVTKLPKKSKAKE
jgi:hypothetical protein